MVESSSSGKKRRTNEYYSLPEAHGIEDVLERGVVGIEIALRRNANEEEQSLRALNGDQPISFNPACRRSVRIVSAQSQRPTNADAPAVPHSTQIGIGLG